MPTPAFWKSQQARGLDDHVTFVVGGDPQLEFLRSTTNIVGVKVLPARVRRTSYSTAVLLLQYPFVQSISSFFSFLHQRAVDLPAHLRKGCSLRVCDYYITKDAASR